MNHPNFTYAFWFPGWFPCRKQPLNGDFVYRHAQAVSSIHPLVVLYISKDPTVKKTEREEIIEGDLTIIRLYYSVKIRIRYLEAFISFLYFLALSVVEFKKLIQLRGKPALIHVHVFQKSVIAGWLLSKRWNLPILLTEHRSGFLKEAEQRFHQTNWLKKLVIRFFLTRMKAITTVSTVLENGLRTFAPKQTYHVIPNVVNTEIFYPRPQNTRISSLKLLHVSTLSANKQVDKIIQAVNIANQLQPNCCSLTIIGPEHKLPKDPTIECLGEMSQESLAAKMNASDVLILFSKYETFGCVAIEAMACGKPVILSDIPVAYELLNDQQMGVIVEKDNVDALAKEILSLYQHHTDVDPEVRVRFIQQKYSYPVVGRQFIEVYRTLINL